MGIVDQLSDFFNSVDLTGPIDLNSYMKIVDPKRFIESHLTVLRRKDKTDRQFELHLMRLDAFKKLIETGELQEKLTPMKRIAVLDIETTGFLKDGGSIVEIGIVELNLDTGEITEVYDSLCREDILTAKHRDAWIFQNSDLTVEEVRNAPSFEQVKEEAQVIIDQYPNGCTAFNNVFDFGFLEDRGIKFPKKLACPMKLSTPICKIPSRNGRAGYKWPNVEEAFKHFFPDLEYQEAHRGADDAKHEAMIVHKLYEMGVFKLDDHA